MMPIDTIAELAGVAEGSPLAAARAARPEFVGGQAACRDAVLVPVHDTGLGHPLRAALAARMAQANASGPLAAYYRDRLAAFAPADDLKAISLGAFPATADTRLRAILRHTDLITVAPRACTRADTLRLVSNGLTVAEAVALSELIGFVNFEVRILATLGLLAEENT